MNTLRLRIHTLQCLETTSGRGADHIKLAGTAVDATGDTIRIPTKINEYLDTNHPQLFSPPRIFTSFQLAQDDTISGHATGWPRTYYVTFIMAEIDNGGFSDTVQDIYERVKNIVAEEVAAAVGGVIGGGGGVLGAALGAAIGYVVGLVLNELFAFFQDWWEDDVFPPITVGITLPFAFMFGERNQCSYRTVWWKAHGGHYHLHYDWELLGPPLVAGVFRHGSDGYALLTQPRSDFEASYVELTTSGQRLVGLSTYVDGSTPMISGAYRAGADKHALVIGDWPTFTAKWAELSKKGLRLIDIDSYPHDGKRIFAGAFRAGTDGHVLWGSDWPSFETKHKECTEQGMRLVSLDTYVENDTPAYVGVWREGTGGHAMWIAEQSSFEEKHQELSGQGLRLVRLSSHMHGGRRIYAGVYREGTGGHHLYITDRWDKFHATWDHLSKLGLRLVDIET